VDDLEQRLTAVEAKSFAFGCIARLLIAKMYSGSPDRLARLREEICNAIECFYEDKLTERGHPFLQLAIAEAEALLGPVGPTNPRPDE
jgi:hypothetical protein